MQGPEALPYNHSWHDHVTSMTSRSKVEVTAPMILEEVLETVVLEALLLLEVLEGGRRLHWAGSLLLRPSAGLRTRGPRARRGAARHGAVPAQQGCHQGLCRAPPAGGVAVAAGRSCCSTHRHALARASTHMHSAAYSVSSATREAAAVAGASRRGCAV